MKIIKTKEIVPILLTKEDEDLYNGFKNRNKLHSEQVPSFFVYILDYAWDAFMNHGFNVYNDTKHEAQGIMIGKYFKDKYGEYVVATKYVEGNGVSTNSYVEMSEECLIKISNMCKEENLLMVIWLHTHPGFGTFYSMVDINCLKTNFYKKYQIGIVVDILQNKWLGYRVDKNNVDKTNGYALINLRDLRLFEPFNEEIKQKKKSEEIITENANIININEIKILNKNIKRLNEILIAFMILICFLVVYFFAELLFKTLLHLIF